MLDRVVHRGGWAIDELALVSVTRDDRDGGIGVIFGFEPHQLERLARRSSETAQGARSAATTFDRSNDELSAGAHHARLTTALRQYGSRWNTAAKGLAADAIGVSAGQRGALGAGTHADDQAAGDQESAAERSRRVQGLLRRPISVR